MKFKTETGSLYEVCLQNKQIRRISGETSPTVRQGQDGDWKIYESISPIEIGNRCYITWKIVDSVAKGTLTSFITEIYNDS